MKKFFILYLIVLFAGCKKNDSTTNGTITTLPDTYSNRGVGASANDLLSSVNYTALKIEIQYMPGFAPDAGAVSHLQSMLNSTLNKTGGIQIVQKQISSGNKGVYSLEDIKLIEKENRTVYTDGGTVGVYLLIVDGKYSDANVLGIAYRNTSTALMGKTINENSGGIGQASRTKLEATVSEHELGHLLGLVNVGTPMKNNHQDAGHGSHCNNTDCLMYYASETTDILGFLITGAVPELDAECKNDLRANGGK